MFTTLKREALTSLIALVFFTLLLGLVYPALVTGLAQDLFAHEANGSLVTRDGASVGSALVGQSFTRPDYFWGRPSAIATPYDATTSSGSNLGPSNPALHTLVKARVRALRDADPTQTAPVPIDLVTASASGLDPHITPAAARYQVPRVARARGLPEAEVQALVDAAVEGRWLGVFGQARVNVLGLNIALDARDHRTR